MFYSEIIQDESSLICIQDSLDAQSLYLVKDFVNGHVKEVGNVHIYCYDRNIEQLQQNYGSSNKHNYYSHVSEESLVSPISWNCVVKEHSFLALLKPNLSDRCYVVVIDSLSGLLIHQNFKDVYRELRQLISQRIFKAVFNIQIIVIVHADALENAQLVIEHLKRLAKVWIDVKPHNVIKLCIKAKNGGSNIKEYEYSIDENGNITSKTECVNKNITNIKKDSPTAEPVSTFNLKLTDAEKLARSNITLPYTRHENISTTNQDDSDTDDRNFSDDYYWGSSEEEDY